MQPSEAGLGDVVVLDVRVFHRAGLPGAHHVEQAVEYVLVDDPSEDGTSGAVLTVEAEQRFEDSGLLGVLYDLRLDLTSDEALSAHPAVEALVEVRQG